MLLTWPRTTRQPPCCHPPGLPLPGSPSARGPRCDVHPLNIPYINIYWTSEYTVTIACTRVHAVGKNMGAMDETGLY